MAVIVNVRGTNGSGKTTVVQELVPAADRQRFVICEHRYTDKKGRDKVKELIGYRVGATILVGRYDTACGGCDGMPSVYAAYQAVEAAAALPGARFVLFEGLMLSGIYQSVVDTQNRLKAAGHEFVWAFMPVPIEECVRRVIARTAKPPGWDPRHVYSKHRAVVRTRERALADGYTVVDLLEPPAQSLIRIAEAAGA